jgi:adenine-specific DNA-methyltransferase
LEQQLFGFQFADVKVEAISRASRSTERKRSKVSQAKRLGQFFTPASVASTLVRWSIRQDTDRILDPSCGNGEFLAAHEYAVGIEYDPIHARSASERAPAALVHQGEFFEWASETRERFEAIVGNPPYIRYQEFSGKLRQRALHQAKLFGANLPELASSWAPFVAASSLLLNPGGRIAFVVPAEIGHAAYAKPLIEALCKNFDEVAILAVRKKLFPSISEDAWILFASGYGGTTNSINFVAQEHFIASASFPRPHFQISLDEYLRARGRLRRWLLPAESLTAYEYFERLPGVLRLGSMAEVNIGYVSGANSFFHLKPSEAAALNISTKHLRVSLRRGGALPAARELTSRHVEKWLADDEQVLLLHLRDELHRLPKSVRQYLDSDAGKEARGAYKCRSRNPWYTVPDVKVPDGFINCMSGGDVLLVRNTARCVATNSLHVVTMKPRFDFSDAQNGFKNCLSQLSREVEGHSLGGGMLKLEPREAQSILIPRPSALREIRASARTLQDGLAEMRLWRHIDDE